MPPRLDQTLAPNASPEESMPPHRLVLGPLVGYTSGTDNRSRHLSLKSPAPRMAHHYMDNFLES
ncbi:hypothetical protein Dda_2174 [Drechslerella dactyloides]|uniref:Uncharacterized protein n=1 Tax=Drechslerella dactyloides TaxID=74499 RepID=A0AAD6NL89_DREDA|nr:hypothetical protein Dda_2174 [Drechslerella dactyloides]